MLHYRVVGSGTPLLLIHGWGVTYGVWQNLEPLLAPYFQLIMLELPGTGSTTMVDWGASYYPACAEAIEELRLMLGIEQWAILAYSTGDGLPKLITTLSTACYPRYFPLSHLSKRAVVVGPVG